MKDKKGSSHMWTKKEIRLVADLWKTKTKYEVAEQLGLNPGQVMYMVNQMRKAGIVMPKKHKKGLMRSLIFEIMNEDGIEPVTSQS